MQAGTYLLLEKLQLATYRRLIKKWAKLLPWALQSWDRNKQLWRDLCCNVQGTRCSATFVVATLELIWKLFYKCLQGAQTCLSYAPAGVHLYMPKQIPAQKLARCQSLSSSEHLRCRAYQKMTVSQTFLYWMISSGSSLVLNVSMERWAEEVSVQC